ncbi:MAG: ribonuclease D [Methylophaga sp.]|nr:ribonuclease D [Methylophaga sp.]
MTVLFVDQPAQLDELCAQLAGSQWLAVDTEFLREKTYYPQLCLIQVANESVIACVDPLALSNLDPLLDLFYHPDMTLVFHAARQDLELLYMLRGELPQKIFDTQLAATMLGYGDQTGYASMVKTLLNVDLDKAHSRTDWKQRPLSDAQLEYAADDVRYLRDIYLIMLESLTKQARLTWLEEDFSALSSSETYQSDPAFIWRKIRGAGKLNGLQLAVLEKLAIWREQQAIQRNRPRRWIIKDEIMLDLARFMPTSMEKLSRIRGYEARDIERDGAEILQLIAKASETPDSEWPVLKKPVPLTNQQEALIDALMALLRKYSDECSVTPSAIASRKDIERLVRGEDDLPLQQGWRNEVVGHYLTDFLDGKLKLMADHQHILIEQG